MGKAARGRESSKWKVMEARKQVADTCVCALVSLSEVPAPLGRHTCCYKTDLNPQHKEAQTPGAPDFKIAKVCGERSPRIADPGGLPSGPQQADFPFSPLFSPICRAPLQSLCHFLKWLWLFYTELFKIRHFIK